MDKCAIHDNLVSDIAVIKADMAVITNDNKHIKDSVDRAFVQICSHIAEGEKVGGYRDRVLKLEQDVKNLKLWVFIMGILGSIIGRYAPDLVGLFLRGL